jgi:hypothetical protein
MPSRGDCLTQAQINLLTRWIAAGARCPDEKMAAHWAYVKPVRPARPVVKNTSWPRNEIDYSSWPVSKKKD